MSLFVRRYAICLSSIPRRRNYQSSFETSENCPHSSHLTTTLFDLPWCYTVNQLTTAVSWRRLVYRRSKFFMHWVGIGQSPVCRPSTTCVHARKWHHSVVNGTAARWRCGAINSLCN